MHHWPPVDYLGIFCLGLMVWAAILLLFARYWDMLFLIAGMIAGPVTAFLSVAYYALTLTPP